MICRSMLSAYIGVNTIQQEKSAAMVAMRAKLAITIEMMSILEGGNPHNRPHPPHCNENIIFCRNRKMQHKLCFCLSSICGGTDD